MGSSPTGMEPRWLSRSTAPNTQEVRSYWADMDRSNELVIGGAAFAPIPQRLSVRTDQLSRR